MASSPKQNSTLNPNALPFDPNQMRGSEADRSIFITFSIGYPLSENQISTFFTRKYGECIEKIYLHYGDTHSYHPLFGRVVFNKRSTPLVILGGGKQVHFTIEGKNLCCKEYKKDGKKN
ncbi:hypothetical protein V2J09_021852 [Rumex salicifolius]